MKLIQRLEKGGDLPNALIIWDWRKGESISTFRVALNIRGRLLVFIFRYAKNVDKLKNEDAKSNNAKDV